jgi:hypothetical protein
MTKDELIAALAAAPGKAEIGITADGRWLDLGSVVVKPPPAHELYVATDEDWQVIVTAVPVKVPF